MISLLERPETAEVGTDDGDDCLVHIVCDACRTGRALCGQEINPDGWLEAGEYDVSLECVVCVNLENQDCVRCGE